MFKRFFWLVVGFIAGLGSSWAIARRLRRLAARYAPPEVADRWGGTMRAAVDEGRAAMRLREAELKAKREWLQRPDGSGSPKRPDDPSLARGAGQ
jgi:hypothetical protein